MQKQSPLELYININSNLYSNKKEYIKRALYINKYNNKYSIEYKIISTKKFMLNMALLFNFRYCFYFQLSSVHIRL